MGSKDTPKMEVTDYSLSVHFALCHGPIDSISRIIVKEKEAWAGKVTTQGGFNVNARSLFGGNKKEGGVGGRVEFLPGQQDQVIPDYIAKRFGRTSATMPAYRGIASVFLSDGSTGRNTKKSYGFDDIRLEGKGGFYWSSNNPYLPDTWIKASRAPRGPLPSGLASISNLVPEAIIGLPEEPEEPEEGEDGEEEEPEVDDAENNEPLNGYYIGALPTETDFIRTKYGFKGTADSVDDDPLFERRIFDIFNQDKLRVRGAIYRNYGDDANGAHMIAECLINTTWGMSAPETALDLTSFLACAQVLFDERFGLSLAWEQQSTIEAMVTEILDHIQAMIFINPRNGLFTLKLIRNDYEVENLRVLTPDNARITSFQRKAWADTINEIVVSWTNPENEKASTVTLQDTANIAIQGGIVSDARNYYGIRNASLAMKVAARDLRSASSPMASFEAELDRAAWDILPGDVVQVVYPEEGIDGAVYRIMDVDYGKIGSSSVKVKFVEDVFALTTQGYTVGGAPRPIMEDGRAEPLDFVSPFTIPYQLASRFGLVSNLAYPEVGVLVLGASDNDFITDFLITSDIVLPNGEMAEAEVGTYRITSHAILSAPLIREYESSIAIFSALTRDGGEPAAGGILVIGSTDLVSELCLIESYDPAIGCVFSRGILDTVPREWPVGTPVWILEFSVLNAIDGTARPADVPLEYNIRPMTDRETLAVEDQQEIEFTPSERPYLPTRPANCKVGGQPWSVVYAVAPATIPLTWANRNRLMEDAVFARWNEGNMSGEVGQSTVIQVLNRGGAVEVEYTVAEGLTSFALPTAGLTGGSMRVRFLSLRDGFLSLQGLDISLRLPVTQGYGMAYGQNYGG